MEHIVDCKVTKVYEGPTGEGEWGPWQVYNLYLDKGEKKKFGWMCSGKKVKPVVGMQLKHVGYEVEEDGGYTNYKIKELELAEEPKSTPHAIPNAKEDMGSIPSESKSKVANNRDASFYVSYMKDISIAIMTSGGDLLTADLDVIARKVAKAGLVMMQESLNGDEKPSEDNKTTSSVNEKKKPRGKPPKKAANGQDPRKEKIICDFLDENQEKGKHTDEEVTAIFCIHNCHETSRCGMAKLLKKKYQMED